MTGYKDTLINLINGDHLQETDYRYLIGIVGAAIAGNSQLDNKDIIEEDKPRRVRTHGGPYNIRGNSFKTIKEVSEFHGVKASTISARMRQGETIEQALRLPPLMIKSSDGSIRVNGAGQ